MKTIEKIVYMTEKGQITLPVAWRRMVGTKAVRIKSSRGDLLEIAPIDHSEDSSTGWVSIFNAQNDNHGRGLSASEFLEAIGRPRTVSRKRK